MTANNQIQEDVILARKARWKAWNRPESKQKIQKLKKLFRKVIILTRVAIILKKLIETRKRWAPFRRRTVIEDLDQINQTSLVKDAFVTVDESTNKICFNTAIFKQTKDNSIQVDKNFRGLLRTPTSLRFTDTIDKINAVLNCRFRITHAASQTIWGRYPKPVRYQLCKYMEYHFVESGKQILKYGHTSFNYYLIYSGKVRVNKPISQSPEKEEKNSGAASRLDKFYTAARLGAGSQFGELGLYQLVNNRRTADVIAETDCELIVIPRVSYSFSPGGFS